MIKTVLKFIDYMELKYKISIPKEPLIEFVKEVYRLSLVAFTKTCSLLSFLLYFGTGMLNLKFFLNLYSTAQDSAIQRLQG